MSERGKRRDDETEDRIKVVAKRLKSKKKKRGKVCLKNQTKDTGNNLYNRTAFEYSRHTSPKKKGTQHSQALRSWPGVGAQQRS